MPNLNWADRAQDIAATRREVDSCKLDHAHQVDNLKRARVAIERALIQDAGPDGIKALGPNESAQQRELAFRLNGDKEWRELCTNLEHAEIRLARAQAEHDAAIDNRRAAEWAVREDLVELAHQLAEMRHAQVMQEPTPAVVDHVVTETAEGLAAAAASTLAEAIANLDDERKARRPRELVDVLDAAPAPLKKALPF